MAKGSLEEGTCQKEKCTKNMGCTNVQKSGVRKGGGRLQAKDQIGCWRMDGGSSSVAHQGGSIQIGLIVIV